MNIIESFFNFVLAPYIMVIDLMFILTTDIINQFDAIISVMDQFIEILIPMAIVLIFFAVLKPLFGIFFGSRSRIPISNQNRRRKRTVKTLDERLDDVITKSPFISETITTMPPEIYTKQGKRGMGKTLSYTTFQYAKTPFNYCLLCLEDTEEEKNIFMCPSCLRIVCLDCYDDLKATNMLKCPHCGNHTQSNLLEVKS